MKQLTVAYENDDLHTILSLQMKEMGASDDEQKKLSDDKIKIYNSILKDQVAELEMRMHAASMHPRYLPFQRYITENCLSPYFDLQIVHFELMDESSYLESLLGRLEGGHNQKLLCSLLREFRE